MLISRTQVMQHDRINRQLNVLHVTRYCFTRSRGGTEVYVRDLALSSTTLGIGCEVLTFGEGGADDRIPVHYLPCLADSPRSEFWRDLKRYFGGAISR